MSDKNKKIPFHKGIRFKVILGIVSILVFTLAPFGFFQIQDKEKLLMKSLKNQMLYQLRHQECSNHQMHHNWSYSPNIEIEPHSIRWQYFCSIHTNGKFHQFHRRLAILYNMYPTDMPSFRWRCNCTLHLLSSSSKWTAKPNRKPSWNVFTTV